MRYDQTYPYHHDGTEWFFMLVFMVLIIIGLFVVIRYLATIDSKKLDGPEEILKRRFASGEIDKKEYEEARKTLKS